MTILQILLLSLAVIGVAVIVIIIVEGVRKFFDYVKRNFLK